MQRWFFAATLLAGLASLWLFLSVRQAGDERDGSALLPDFYVEQPRWQVFDEHGLPKRELLARRLEQWPGEDRARLFEPRLRLTDVQQQHWRASAQRGWIAADQRHMVLETAVNLQREAGDGDLVLHTEKLRIDDKGDVIETDQPVVLVSGNWHFSATGLHAELGRQQLQLLGNVRGIHD
ncbi:MAG: LPS export ABC transporter periplasmic protein LptC [Thiogranum sp.]|jgi:LPS export ABC transporter protein LptC|nr:LPS export ABC transporter periplasmic protein LptC [Thiogranum sp.]